MFRKFLIIFWASIFCIESVAATAPIISLNKFEDIISLITRSGDPKRTLLVMDNDDTLTMMPCSDPTKPYACQYLGGPAWFDWQTSLLNSPSAGVGGRTFRVADSQSQLIDIASTLMTLNYMEFTDVKINAVLTMLSNQGVRFLVATDRGSNDLSASVMQFNYLKISSQTLLSFMSRNSLMFGGIASLPSPFYPCGDRSMRPVSYSQGTLYGAGQDKGVLLSCLLHQYDTHQPGGIASIYFLDDALKNVKDVQKKFQDSKAYTVTPIHYTKLENHKRALTSGDKRHVFQKQARDRWDAIKSVLQQQLIKPSLGQ